MKKLALAATGFVLGLAVLGFTVFTGNNTAEAAQCNVTADVPSIGTKIKQDRKWTQKDGRAYIVAVVHGKGCKMPVSVASWKAPSASGLPYKDQVFFKGHSATLKEGRHLLSVDKPECFFQVDLVHGLNPHPGGKRGPNYGDLFIAGAIGGNKKCEMPKATCEGLNVVKLSRTKFRFNATASLDNGAGLRAYVFTIKRNGAVVTTKTVRTNATNATLDFQTATRGSYTVSVKVLTSEGEKTSAACNGAFTVTAPKPGKIEVCEIATGNIVEIDQNQMSDKYTTDLSKCETPLTPETPKALPNTGAGAVVALFTGVTSLSSAAYYFISRRFL
jgi:LPXTG-motif cell wall-anchored protein